MAVTISAAAGAPAGLLTCNRNRDADDGRCRNQTVYRGVCSDGGRGRPGAWWQAGRGGSEITARGDEQERRFLEAALPHLDAVYRVARHTVGDHHQAEDLVQETYLRAYAAFAGHHGPSTRAWLVAICLNLARSQGRRQARRPREAPLASAPEAASVAHGVAEQALAGLDRDRVAAALAQLPEDQRRAIVLMDLAGHTAAEVAEMLGRPRNTVLSWAFRGRQRLAAVLNEEGADHDLL